MFFHALDLISFLGEGALSLSSIKQPITNHVNSRINDGCYICAY